MKAVDALRQRLGLSEEQARVRDAEEARRQLVRDYRETFLRPAGRRVFAHMMRELGLFERAAGPRDEALRDYAGDLIRNLGLDSIADLSNQVLDTPFQEETTR